MKYFLFKISITNGRSEKIHAFESDLIPNNIYAFDDLGFLVLFKKHHCIGLVNKKGLKTWVGLPNNHGAKKGSGIFASMDYPSSLCRQNKGDVCYVVESGGAKIRRIDVCTGYTSDFFGSVISSKMNKFLSNCKNIGDINTSCCIEENGAIYWVSSRLHRCFKSFNSDVITLVGTGKPGYSVSNVVANCMLSYPSGIAVDKGSIYISDTGNHCIRRLGDNSFCVVVGNPTKPGDEDGDKSLLNNPTGLRMSKKILYFIDDKKVKYYSVNQKNVGTLYSSDKIVSIDVDEKGSLFVLETEK